MWKVNKAMAIWGIAFGILATISGMLLLDAVQEGFFAEGFFLIVLSWIVVTVLIAKLIQRMSRPKVKDDEEI